MRLIVLIFVAAALGCATRQPQTVEDPSPSYWDLTADLNEAQRATNAQIYATLDPDEHDAENEFDPLAFELASRGPADARAGLRALEFGGDRKHQAAAGRAYVFLAQRALAAAELDLAADLALHVYLSSTPHRLRIEALRVYCASADPDASARWIGLIETAEQDPRFGPLTGELRRLRTERIRAPR